jgi:acetyl-CoA acetyltransferase
MSFPLDVSIASATRTAVGRGIKGALRDTRPDDLAGVAIAEALRRVPGLRGEDIEDVVLGCAMPEGEQGLNIARTAVFLAGLPDTVPAETINRFCSSGLQAIAHGARSVATGMAEAVIAGGVESMSMVPMSGNKVSLNPARRRMSSRSARTRTPRAPLPTAALLSRSSPSKPGASKKVCHRLLTLTWTSAPAPTPLWRSSANCALLLPPRARSPQATPRL